MENAGQSETMEVLGKAFVSFTHFKYYKGRIDKKTKIIWVNLRKVEEGAKFQTIKKEITIANHITSIFDP